MITRPVTSVMSLLWNEEEYSMSVSWANHKSLATGPGPVIDFPKIPELVTHPSDVWITVISSRLKCYPLNAGMQVVRHSYVVSWVCTVCLVVCGEHSSRVWHGKDDLETAWLNVALPRDLGWERKIRVENVFSLLFFKRLVQKNYQRE